MLKKVIENDNNDNIQLPNDDNFLLTLSAFISVPDDTIVIDNEIKSFSFMV